MVELGEAVVGNIVRHLQSHIAELDTRHRCAIFQRPELNHEEVQATIDRVHDQPRSDNCMGARVSDRAGPEFDRCCSRGMKNEFVGVWVEGCCRLHAPDIGTVPELRGAVCANHLSRLGKG